MEIHRRSSQPGAWWASTHQAKTHPAACLRLLRGRRGSPEALDAAIGRHLDAHAVGGQGHGGGAAAATAAAIDGQDLLAQATIQRLKRSAVDRLLQQPRLGGPLRQQVVGSFRGDLLETAAGVSRQDAEAGAGAGK